MRPAIDPSIPQNRSAYWALLPEVEVWSNLPQPASENPKFARIGGMRKRLKDSLELKEQARLHAYSSMLLRHPALVLLVFVLKESPIFNTPFPLHCSIFNFPAVSGNLP